MKTKIILSGIVLLSAISFYGIANAASASLYVYPTNVVKTVGDVFDASVVVNPSGSNACAVEGTLVFNNLTCQDITMTGDFVVQSLPTCSNPHFLVGIPNCTLSEKALFAVKVKAETATNANISVSDIEIIGEGMSIGSTAVSGIYTINPVYVPKIVQPIQEVIPQKVEEPIQQAEELVPEVIEGPIQQTEELEPGRTHMTDQEIASMLKDTGEASLVGDGLNNGYIWVVLIIIILGIVYYFIRKQKK